MKKSSSPAKLILLYFLSWRALLFVIAYFAIFLIPRFGARFPYFDTALEITNLPSWIWSFGNFDGVHYLRIAQDGYSSQYSQAFFPLYPLLIRFFNFLPKNFNLDTRIYTDPSYFYTGFILSNILFLISLLIFYKLIRLDNSRRVSLYSIVLLLVFPTSYYFGGIYSESLFLFLALSCIYLIRKKKFILSGILAALASATRIIGLLLFIVLVIEIFKEFRSIKRIKIKNYLSYMASLLIAPLGTVAYMVYLNKVYGNAFYFLTSQPAFGANRESLPLILLPQVLYRYIKILLSVSINTLTFLNASLEMLFTLIPFVLLIILFRKIRLSYWVFMTGSLLIPTLTGTLSSMPRYTLLCFLLLPVIVKTYEKYYRWILAVSVILLALLTALFARGYWVA